MSTNAQSCYNCKYNENNTNCLFKQEPHSDFEYFHQNTCANYQEDGCENCLYYNNFDGYCQKLTTEYNKTIENLIKSELPSIDDINCVWNFELVVYIQAQRFNCEYFESAEII